MTTVFVLVTLIGGTLAWLATIACALWAMIKIHQLYDWFLFTAVGATLAYVFFMPLIGMVVT